MSALGFSPNETYRVVISGDVLQHIQQIVTNEEPLHEDCLTCERYRRALALAEYHLPVEAA